MDAFLQSTWFHGLVTGYGIVEVFLALVFAAAMWLYGYMVGEKTTLDRVYRGEYDEDEEEALDADEVEACLRKEGV